LSFQQLAPCSTDGQSGKSWSTEAQSSSPSLLGVPGDLPLSTFRFPTLSLSGSSSQMTIPVICDRCRVAGTAGTGDFSHFGDLLDFDPVKVRHRVNGWDADAQRAFIALLATTGSKRRAAQAIGRNAF